MNHSLPSERKRTSEVILETLLTEDEYARITKRSVASVRRDRLLRQGCPYVKLGALVRYRPQDVRTHLERSLRRPDQLCPLRLEVPLRMTALHSANSPIYSLRGGQLAESDYLALERSWISRELADQAMLRRVLSFDGAEIVGRRNNGSRHEGVIFPYMLGPARLTCANTGFAAIDRRLNAIRKDSRRRRINISALPDAEASYTSRQQHRPIC